MKYKIWFTTLKEKNTLQNRLSAAFAFQISEILNHKNSKNRMSHSEVSTYAWARIWFFVNIMERSIQLHAKKFLVLGLYKSRNKCRIIFEMD